MADWRGSAEVQEAVEAEGRSPVAEEPHRVVRRAEAGAHRGVWAAAAAAAAGPEGGGAASAEGAALRSMAAVSHQADNRRTAARSVRKAVVESWRWRRD